jgi:hypothetical protein
MVFYLHLKQVAVLKFGDTPLVSSVRIRYDRGLPPIRAVHRDHWSTKYRYGHSSASEELYPSNLDVEIMTFTVPLSESTSSV